MKKLLLTFSCLSALTLSAQNGILKTIGGAAKNKVEQQDFNSTRTNKEKGNSLNDERRSAPAPAPGSMPSDTTAVQPADTTKKAATPTPAVTPPVFGNTKYDNTYTFGQKVTYRIDRPSKPSDEAHTVTYYYGDNATMSVVEDKQMNIIMDFTNASTIMINEKDQTATAMAARSTARAVDQQAGSGSKATVTKTGNRKQILGYNCEEYLVQSETSKSLIWTTIEIKLDYTKAMLAMSKNMGAVSQTDGSELGGGMMMEMTGYNKKGEADTHLLVTDYQKEEVVKALSAYKMTVL